MDRQVNSAQGRGASARFGSHEREPLLKTLTATLADIDFIYEADLTTIMTRTGDEPLKRKAIERLQQHHQERRAPYVRELEILRQRV